jgi:hypothetical protein
MLLVITSVYSGLVPKTGFLIFRWTKFHPGRMVREVVQWSPSSYSFHFERTITDIRGDTIFFRNPVVMAMEAQYGGGKVYKATRQRIQNIGVEYMLLESVYASDTDENHAWDAVMFRNAEHGWARFITAKYFGYSCVNLERESRYITVTDCKQLEPKSLITGSRRYSFNNVGQKTSLSAALHPKDDMIMQQVLVCLAPMYLQTQWQKEHIRI